MNSVQALSGSMRERRLPPLYAIANVDSLKDPLRYVKALLEAGAALIQLRAKHLETDGFIDLGIDSVRLRDRIAPRAAILINDSPEVCLACGADGVHLGQDDMAAENARELLGDRALIGLSTHSIEQIEGAPAPALDYLALGPIFHSPTKSGHAEPLGTGLLRRAVERSPLPLVAIGGITLNNAEEVFAAGAASAAVISDLAQSASLRETVRRYCEQRAHAAGA